MVNVEHHIVITIVASQDGVDLLHTADVGPDVGATAQPDVDGSPLLRWPLHDGDVVGHGLTDEL